MDKVLPFPDGAVVKYRVCPHCGYIRTNGEIQRSLIDHKCPKCYRHRQSEFRAVRSTEHDPSAV